MTQAALETCDICVAAPAENFCVNCRQEFCDLCKGFHMRQNISRNHNFKDLKPSCKEHSKGCILFCSSCDELVCKICLLQKHNGHIFCNIDGEKEHQKPEIGEPVENEHQKQEVTGEPTEILYQREKVIESEQPHNGMEHIRNMHEDLIQFLNMTEFDKRLQDELSTAFPDYRETGAGKTSLVNLLVERENMFYTCNIAATATVCRIRNSDTLKVKIYTKADILIKEVEFDDEKELKSFIRKYTDINKLQQEIQDVYYVDIHLPISILKGNVTLVDTPGIGENEQLDRILMDFLPHAVSFVFVVNASNAGGVRNDTLKKIMKTVMNNHHIMPCFDPRDVIFLTNKWDIIENGSDEDGETEKDQTWKKINTSLKEAWGSITNDNVFKVSLKQVSQKISKEFTDEFGRFKKILQRNINKNQNKRKYIYNRFFDTFTYNAQRGILARLQQFQREENELMKKSKKDINDLIADAKLECNKAKTGICEHIEEITRKLADMLHDYLHSDNGKEQILNQEGYQPIIAYPYGSLKDEVPKRLQIGIQRWWAGEEVKQIMWDTYAKILFYKEKIEEQLLNVEVNITGLEDLRETLPEIPEISSKDVNIMLFVFVTFYNHAFRALSDINVNGDIVKPFIITIHKKKSGEIYEECLRLINRKILQETLSESLGKTCNQIIVRFDNALQRQLNYLKNLYGERRDTMWHNKETLLRLKCQIDKIRNKQLFYNKHFSCKL